MHVIGRWILLLSLLLVFSLHSQAQNVHNVRKSCRTFVQSFYDWYAKRPEWYRALQFKPSAFSPELYRRLKEDHEAQAKVPGDIVGLDFDPILNSQDPGEHYLASRIELKGEGTCWAEVSGATGEKNKEPDVAAELVNHDGRWHFVNFYYPAGNSDFSVSVSHGGLLATLKDLREARQKASTVSSRPKRAPEPQNTVPAPKHPAPVPGPRPRKPAPPGT